MFGIGPMELIIILVIALVFIGPKKLPDLARALGKGMSEFRKATQEIKDSLDLDEIQDIKEELVDSISEVGKTIDLEEDEYMKVYEETGPQKDSEDDTPETPEEEKSKEDTLETPEKGKSEDDQAETPEKEKSEDDQAETPEKEKNEDE